MPYLILAYLLCQSSRSYRTCIYCIISCLGICFFASYPSVRILPKFLYPGLGCHTWLFIFSFALILNLVVLHIRHCCHYLMCPSYHIHHIHPTHYNRILLYVRFLHFLETCFSQQKFLNILQKATQNNNQKSNLRLQKKTHKRSKEKTTT